MSSSVINSNLGLPFQEGDQASNARRNATIVMSAKGTEIASVPATMQIPLFRCLETSSGYIENEVYVRTADNLGVRNIRRKHTHSADTDEEGGTFQNILVNNPRTIIFGQAPFNNVSDFNVTKTGTADFVFFSDPATYGRYITLYSPWDTTGLTGHYVNASVAGQKIGFSDKILGMVRIYMYYNANQVSRFGFGMEQAQNTIDITRKIGMEMCGSTGTNWQAVSANGITRSTSATSINAAPVPNYWRTFKMYFNPETVSYKLSTTDGVIKLMTTTIPSGGTIDYPRLFRMGLNTTNTTAKLCAVLRVFFVAQNADPDWFDSPDA